MPEPVDSASSFTIRELTGPGRELRLVGRGLPYRPYNLKTSQRVEVTWYPGNPHGTSTVLGAKEEPTQVDGYWKDKFVQTTVDDPALRANVTSPITLNGSAVASVMDAADSVDSIVRAGQLVEVTWDRTTRHGHLRAFDKKWHNPHDLEWSMFFEWISRGERTVPAVFIAEVSLSDSSGQFNNLNQTLQDVAIPPGFDSSADFQSNLNGYLSTISSLVLEVQDSVSNVAKQATEPSDAVRRAIALITSMVLSIDELTVFLNNEVPGGYDSATLIGEQTFQQRLNTAAYNRAVIRAARKLRRASIDNRAKLSKQIKNDLLGTYSARSGENLRDVASMYYGSPFEWRRLLLFNELTTPVLSAGQLVLIPRKTGTERR